MAEGRGEKVLVIGADGMLGSDLVALLRSRQRQVVGSTWPEHLDQYFHLDITDARATAELIDQVAPAVVFNCSGYTDVDGAQQQEELATAVNGRGVANLALASSSCDSLFVHVSTDYVFSGSSRTPYRPDDQPDPQGAYGRSKLAGEEATKAIGGRYLIIRTSWLFGRNGKNFVDTIVALARQRPDLKVVDDQIGCPTYAPDLARCLVDLADKDVQGIHHFCNGPCCSWFDLACAAVEIADLDCKVSPCSTSEFPRPAPRPAYSVLDCSETFDLLGWTARPWPQSVAEHLSQTVSP
jgi:dTDP-4-dehydrorhamnose reductase